MRRFLALALSLILVSGCAPAQPVDANQSADVSQPPSQSQQQPVWTQDDYSGKRLLLVEDVELNREIAEVILGEAGFVIESAPDGTDAVAMVEQSTEGYYDAILMDVQMPIMNGYEATRAIRASEHPQAKTIPIIAMTANAFDDDVRQALDSGMNAHLAKPIDMEKLKAIIAKLREEQNA